MKHPLAHAVDSRLADSLVRIESQIDYRPVKVAAWGMATASVLGAVAAGFGAVAAVAGAYVAVRHAIKVTREANGETPASLPEPEVQYASDITE